MSTKWIVKLNFLVLGLVICLMLMSGAENQRFQRSMDALFGQTQGAKASSNVGLSEPKGPFEKLDWCQGEAGVESLALKRGAENRLADRGALSRWLQNNCSANVQILSSKKEASPAEKIIAEIVLKKSSGEDIRLSKSGAGSFRLGDLWFESKQLDLALSHLVELVREKDPANEASR